MDAGFLGTVKRKPLESGSRYEFHTGFINAYPIAKNGYDKFFDVALQGCDVLLKKEAGYFRKRLELSKNSSSYDCPDCNEKMRRFTITARQKTDYTSVGGFVFSALSMDKIKQIDGCSMCDLLWLDVDEENLLSGKGHNIIRNSQ